MKRAIYPGSFDPVTNGHLDVVERARKLFDEVIVAVANNDQKQALFSLKERLDLLQQTVGKMDNVRIAQFDGLLVEFALRQKANAVIRGLRAVSDFEFEFQMALMNRKLEGNVETIFLMPEAEEVRCVGPMQYKIDIGVSEGSLWANGSLKQPVELTCVACLEKFVHDIKVPAFALHTELHGPETVDLGPFMREDILLNLPAHPRCDREGGRVCKAAAAIAAAAETKRKADWSVLDKLKLER